MNNIGGPRRLGPPYISKRCEVSSSKRTLARFAWAGLPLVFAIELSGCSQPHSRVHGTVKYKGQPVADGSIVFLSQDNQTYPAHIRDGAYEIASVPRGHLQVAIQSGPQRPRPRAMPSAEAQQAKAKNSFASEERQKDDLAKSARRGNPDAPPAEGGVPAIYSNPAKSGLAVDISEADQEHSFDLK
jgi:hypothetical protein